MQAGWLYLVVQLKLWNKLNDRFKCSSKRCIRIQLKAIDVDYHQMTWVSLDHMQKLMTVATARMGSIN